MACREWSTVRRQWLPVLYWGPFGFVIRTIGLLSGLRVMNVALVRNCRCVRMTRLAPFRGTAKVLHRFRLSMIFWTGLNRALTRILFELAIEGLVLLLMMGANLFLCRMMAAILVEVRRPKASGLTCFLGV